MDDDVAEVQQHPPSLGLAFATDRLDAAALAQLVLDLIGDRADLDVGIAGRDDEVVGDHEQIGDVDRDDVVCLLIAGGLCRNDREFP